MFNHNIINHSHFHLHTREEETYLYLKTYEMYLDNRHSIRLNAEVMARAWQILGSLVLRVNIILQVLILLLNVPCMKLTKNL